MPRAKPSQPETPVGGEEATAHLAALRILTRATGQVYEAQALQLRFWPQILFPVQAVTVVPDTSDRIVTFDILLNDSLPTGEDLTKRLDALDRWVHDLLGDDWKLTISTRRKKGAKTKVLYRGERAAPLADVAKLPPAEPGAVFQQPLTAFRRYRLDEKTKAEDIDAVLPPLTKAQP